MFLDDVRVPADHLVGPLDGGWRVLQTALAYERSVMGDLARGPREPTRRPRARRVHRRPTARPTWSPARRRPAGAEVDLWALAKEWAGQDLTIRQAIARVHELRKVNAWNGLRAKAQLEQGSSSPILSLGKLAMSGILHEGAHVQRLIVGSEALLVRPRATRSATTPTSCR